MLDTIFYVIRLPNENVKTLYKYVEKDKYEQEMKEISELDNFLEFVNDNGEYKFLTKSDII